MLTADGEIHNGSNEFGLDFAWGLFSCVNVLLSV